MYLVTEDKNSWLSPSSHSLYHSKSAVLPHPRHNGRSVTTHWLRHRCLHFSDVPHSYLLHRYRSCPGLCSWCSVYTSESCWMETVTVLRRVDRTRMSYLTDLAIWLLRSTQQFLWSPSCWWIWVCVYNTSFCALLQTHFFLIFIRFSFFFVLLKPAFNVEFFCLSCVPKILKSIYFIN